LQADRGPQERHPGHPQDQVLRGEAEVPAGEEAVRRAGRHRAVQPGTPQHDGADQGKRGCRANPPLRLEPVAGAAEAAGPDAGEARQLPGGDRQGGQRQADDRRGQAVQGRATGNATGRFDPASNDVVWSYSWERWTRSWTP
jgi:hypothetical protein